jgi:transposase
MSKGRREVFRYSLSFKQQVIREIEQEGLSIVAAKRKYGIKGGVTIQRWLRKFGKTELLNQIIRIETMDERDKIQVLEAEIKKLKLALADSLLAQRSLEVVIDEANKEYKTDLKKSFGESVSSGSAKSSG